MKEFIEFSIETGTIKPFDRCSIWKQMKSKKKKHASQTSSIQLNQLLLRNIVWVDTCKINKNNKIKKEKNFIIIFAQFFVGNI